jgi:hypothetical protein
MDGTPAFHFRPAISNLLELPDDSIVELLLDSTPESYRLAGKPASLLFYRTNLLQIMD